MSFSRTPTEEDQHIAIFLGKHESIDDSSTGGIKQPKQGRLWPMAIRYCVLAAIFRTHFPYPCQRWKFFMEAKRMSFGHTESYCFTGVMKIFPTQTSCLKMGVSTNRGTPKWMVYKFIMENLIKMDDLGGPPLFLETPRRKIPQIHCRLVDFWQATYGWKASAGREVKRVARETRDAMVLLRHTAKHGEQQVP